jgi:RpiB/LacA/LacB family sugar-phosphate isomerase
MIAIGCDHGGFELKEKIVEHLKETHRIFKDFGIHENISCDYPDIAEKVCLEILENECSFGILICGTGIGMSIAANKFIGIRAAHITDKFSAKMARMHNNAQIICLGGRITNLSDALDYIDIFLNTEFEGDRHERRINKIAEIEQKVNEKYRQENFKFKKSQTCG